MSEFKVKFRGVRGSYPIAKSEFLTYGGNTACVEVHAGNQLIILDAGTGLIDLGSDLLESHINSALNKAERKNIKATMLLSHIHQDHIQGFTFFRPLHLPSTILNVFGNCDFEDDLAQELSTLLFNKSFPLDLGDMAGQLNIHNLQETDCIILNEGEAIVKRIESDEDLIPQDEQVIITCYKSYAHPQNGVMIYKIAYKDKSLVYATDKESYIGGDKKLAKFARNCNLLIHDAQYTTEDYLDTFSPKQGYGHSTYEMAIDAQKQINAEKLVFFHFDPSYDDNKLDRIKEEFGSETRILAYEGLEIDLL
ncbi:MAG: MBL fold metallo-hydrolase [Fusobacterium sp.]|nr:MBL fold metallo-hydrolase [Fusobacterium sp.]